MKIVWLRKEDGKSTIPFNKVYKKEKIYVNGQVIVVHNDKNFQVVSVEGHPELSFLRGRPFVLCIEQIKETCRKEDSDE